MSTVHDPPQGRPSAFERIRLDPIDGYIPDWHIPCFSTICVPFFVAEGITHVFLDVDGNVSNAYDHDNVDPAAQMACNQMTQAGLVLCLATNNEWNLDHLADSLGATYIFTPPIIEASDGVPTIYYKPHPIFLGAALAQAGFPDPERVVMIGDTPAHDVVAGQQAGTKTMLVDRLDHHGFFAAEY